MQAIGARLSVARRATKLTQQAASVELGVSRQAVSSWERGASLPNVLELRKLAILYGVSADYLLFGIGSPVNQMIADMIRQSVKPSDQDASLSSLATSAKRA